MEIKEFKISIDAPTEKVWDVLWSDSSYRDGVEDTISERVSEWAGAPENYSLKTVNGKTELSVDLNITDEFMDYSLNTWPKALDKSKRTRRKKINELIFKMINGSQNIIVARLLLDSRLL